VATLTGTQFLDFKRVNYSGLWSYYKMTNKQFRNYTYVQVLFIKFAMREFAESLSAQHIRLFLENRRRQVVFALTESPTEFTSFTATFNLKFLEEKPNDFMLLCIVLMYCLRINYLIKYLCLFCNLLFVS